MAQGDVAQAHVGEPCEDGPGSRRGRVALLEERQRLVDRHRQHVDDGASAERVLEDVRAVATALALLARLADVGLGYVTLGQPLTTLSGGERQRLRLASQMGEKGDVYVLDEPTTGLHLADVENLLGLLDRLVEAGRSVIVIEHHQAVMAHADRIIDLGPGAGHDGGRVVFEGTPAELVADRTTLTGRHLAAYVGG
ncbi:MAG: ATP-binding cassette domain-containing protein [Nocardioides sp.]